MWFDFFAFYKKQVLIFHANSAFPSFLLGVKQCCIRVNHHSASLYLYRVPFYTFLTVEVFETMSATSAAALKRKRERTRERVRVEKKIQLKFVSRKNDIIH